jgi:hypothetical protein
MQDELLAIKEAWDKDLDGGRDEVRARELADAFVANNPDLYVGFENFAIEDLVTAVDRYREAGPVGENDQWKIEAWLLHHFEPQKIGGIAEPQVRITDNG